MSWWQRIAVVISVLWLAGFPIALMMDANQRANLHYASCLKTTDGISTFTADPMRAQDQLCRAAFNASIMPPAKLVELLTTGKEAWLLWTMILAPVAALWVVGGIAIATVRSIMRTAGRGVGLHKI